MITKQEALDYHEKGRAGKIEVISSKPCATQKDLSLAYTPGVAEPCREIERDPDASYCYTARGNLVAVVSNGTAVLGLGDIGALAGKPVMEGKGILFKRFADIDVFDIEVNTKDPDEVIKVVELLEPTFGGINLEDIKAPECFYIEETLKKKLSIPVFHDDQHGTAIISGAALLNALELAGKDIAAVEVVICGAGAAGIACAKHYVNLGVTHGRIMLTDSNGVVYKGRAKGMNPYKEEFARDTEKRTLADALEGADVFVGLSGKGLVSRDMVRSMAEKPIVFAMANPDPEISYEDAKEARQDVIMATGRSDYPNQVNNVLGFPFIFRGALDVRATTINEEMKRAATRALATLAKEDVPDVVLRAYNVDKLLFGPDYIIPKPLDPRVLTRVAPAVAQAAMDTGVARMPLHDLEAYREQLECLGGKERELARRILNKARRSPKRIVFPEGDNDRILRACSLIIAEGIAHPILIGKKERIEHRVAELGLDILAQVQVVDPKHSPRLDQYTREYYEMRKRKGNTLSEARNLLRNRNVFGSMMVHMGDADGIVSGISHHYGDTLRPALQVIGLKKGVKKAAGLFIIVIEGKVLFFSDPAVNIEPDSEELAEIALLSSRFARRMDVEPRVAMLSFSNFGSVRHPSAEKVRRAAELARHREPTLIIDGEMQADTALLPEIIRKHYPFSTLKDEANVFIFPDLQSANITYRMLHRLGGAQVIGPVLLGMARSAHVVQMECDVQDVLTMTAIAVLDAIGNE